MTQGCVNPYWFAVTEDPGNAARSFETTGKYAELSNWFTGDSSVAIFSFWFSRNATGVTHTLFANSNDRVRLQILSTNNFIQISLKETIIGSVVYLADSNPTTIPGDNSWHHLLVSLNLTGTNQSWMYLDDVDVENIITGPNNGTIDFTRVINRIAANSAATPAVFFNGCLSEVYIQVGQFLDMDITANRRLFIDASGNPVDLGSDGSTPTGVQPEVYIPGDDFADNKGTLANLAEVGSPTVCGTTPF